MSEGAVLSFPSYRYSDIFGMTGGSALILVMTACGNVTFTWVVTVKTSLFYLLIQLTNSFADKGTNW